MKWKVVGADQGRPLHRIFVISSLLLIGVVGTTNPSRTLLWLQHVAFKPDAEDAPDERVPEQAPELAARAHYDPKSSVHRLVCPPGEPKRLTLER